MANAAYNKWLEKQASAAPVAFLTDTIRAAILSSSYVFSQSHEFFSDLTGVLGTANLASKTVTNGVLNAASTVVTGVLASPGHIVVVYKWTGSGATSQLMRYFDTGLGFDQTPTEDTTIVWPSDPLVGIFPLGGKP